MLIVEDEAGMARALRRGLEREGFVVEHAADGRSGLAAARFGAFDAVLLDVMLPGLSGYNVVKALRAEGNWVPVLMISAKDGEYDEADGLDYGADDWLTKPFSFVVLLARLRALLRRGASPRPVLVSAGGIELDPGTRGVQVDGADVELAPREFALLETLLRAAPTVVAKQALLESVWDDPDTDPNVVEVYVGYLRRKLGRERIETVRGVGYRIRP